MEFNPEALTNQFANSSLADVVRYLGKMVEYKEEVEAKMKHANKVIDLLRKQILPSKMEDDGVSSTTLTGVGRINLRSDLFASITAENREAAFDWLRDNGHGGIIRDTVHSATLKAVVKEMLRNGEILPPDEILKVTPYDIAVFTRERKI